MHHMPYSNSAFSDFYPELSLLSKTNFHVLGKVNIF